MKITVPGDVNSILEKLSEAGYQAFIVGGCVRDMLMGRQPHDFDVTTSARPEQVRAIFDGLMLPDGRKAKVIDTGIKHGTVTVLAGGGPVEVTTFRVEGGYSDGRHPDFVEFTGSLQEDLARRDFTMNALAWNPEAGLMDYFGGQQDIEAGCIRAVGDADARFKEDALRILRAIRFASVLGFEIEKKTETAMMADKELLARISAERIQVELTKLLTGPGAGRIVMKYADIIGVVIPEILAMKGFDQKNLHHIYDVLEHSATAIDNIRQEPHLRWAALLHDAGKPETFTVDEGGTGHFYGHAARSEELARLIMRRLRFDNETARRVTDLVKYHDLQIELTDKAVKRALNRLGEETLRDLILVKRADNLAQSPEFADRQQYYDQLEELLERIISENQCFSLKDLAIDGNDLIKARITDGRTIGQTLKAALAEVIDGRLTNEKETLLAWACIKQEEKLLEKNIYVIGHKTPDSDSVCSAIALAGLRGCTPARAGEINRETEFILKYFGAEVPELLGNLAGQQVILVDHNKRHHAAAGIEAAQILEIVDHHFFGSDEDLTAPVIKSEILGSTAAIVCGLYEEAGKIPDRQTAGLLLGAIISDTLFFKSPNSTEIDKQAAEKLAVLAGVDIDDFAGKVLAAASDLSGKSISEIYYQDYKVFRGNNASFGCGALTLAAGGDTTGLEREIISFMEGEQAAGREETPDLMLFMLTSLLDERTAILCGSQLAAEVVKKAYEGQENFLWTSDRIIRTDAILSRKTQLVPQVTKAADAMKK